jgi:hypothetical protein
MSDGHVVRLNRAKRKVTGLTDRERQLLLDELAEITVEHTRVTQVAQQIAGPSPARQARPA